jgi:molecular chaperone DnaK (HSP70)
MSDERLIVGIDLGTTHTVVARATATGRETPVVVPIEQLVADGEVAARPLYASSLYVPLEEESARLPNVLGDAPFVTGELAKKRGAEVPGRSIASAKSWLCHPGVDRLAPILPWGAEDANLARLSPVDASARLLAHVRRAWDEAHPEQPLFEQDVVLTVPASFDETARELTVRAAELAGLEVRLLEEPLAAFYDFLSRTPEAALRDLALRAKEQEAFVLVVDVGGGTTDLSLLAVRIGKAGPSTPGTRPTVERIAVGRHLLLGGDNMDLALAHACEPRLCAEGTKLEPGRFVQLTSACRTAKERLLGSKPPPQIPIAIAGSGSQLVGATRRTELTAAEVERIVLDGFFPLVARDARPVRAKSALVAFGLPYERDVAITRHIAEFVGRHVPEGRTVSALLLNGGVFNAARARARIAELFASWGGSLPEILPHADPDLAVARGAVAYGLALRGLALRVAAGAARAYYVGLGASDQVMCIVPRGAPEETILVADSTPLSLVVGKPVRFDLYMSGDAPPQTPGDLIALSTPGVEFERVPPLAAHFPGSRFPGDTAKMREESVNVRLEGKLTAVGTLELACVERAGAERRFRLAFQTRFDEGAAQNLTPPPPAIGGTSIAPSISARSMPPRSRVSAPPASTGTRRFDEASDAIDRAFGKARSDATGREAKDLVRELERILGERMAWTMELTRSLFDLLANFARARRRSTDHERVFWMLAGFCLRPGFGDPGDDARVRLLVPLFAERLAFPEETRSWTQFFIAWRRIAPGLDDEAQTAIRDFVDPFLAPPEAGLKKPKKPKLEADFDMLELAAALERVGAKRRVELGGWIVERTWTERDPRLWAALGRLGARVPTYASAHHVVPPLTAERWLDHLLREKWEAIPTAGPAALEIGRLTGDRARDVSERVRADVARRLEALAGLRARARFLREVVTVSEEERRAAYGEDLPPGLRLAPPTT